MQVFAEEICYKLQHMLKDKKEVHGTVHSVFNRVCNIIFEDWPIVSLISESIPMKPMSISLKSLENISMHELGLETDQRILYRQHRLEIPEACFTLYLSNSRGFDCRPVFDFNMGSINQIKLNIDELRVVLEHGNIRGLLPMISNFEESSGEKYNTFTPNRYSEFAWPRVDKLIRAISQGDLTKISDKSRGIAGFGPGLTPSSDDMLIGLMISLIYASRYYNWGRQRAEAINSAILRGAEGRTTQLSYEMMSYAAKGEVTKSIHQLMGCIYSNSTQLIYRSALDVMDYGETSGSDMLCGIYMGCKTCISVEENKQYIK
jgi:hypothetical protein